MVKNCNQSGTNFRHPCFDLCPFVSFFPALPPLVPILKNRYCQMAFQESLSVQEWGRSEPHPGPYHSFKFLTNLPIKQIVLIDLRQLLVRWRSTYTFVGCLYFCCVTWPSGFLSFFPLAFWAFLFDLKECWIEDKCFPSFYLYLNFLCISIFEFIFQTCNSLWFLPLLPCLRSSVHKECMFTNISSPCLSF